TWMSEVMSGGLDPKEIPFAQYLWQQVMLQFASELNDNTTYFGFDKALAAAFNAGTAYAAGDYMIYNNDFYKALSATNAGETPDSHPAKWQMVNAEAIAVGIKSILEEEISNGKIVEEAIGAIDNANVYAHAAFLKLYRSASTPYKRAGIVIHASFTDVELLMDDIRDQFGKYTEKDMMAAEDGSFVLPGSNGRCRVKPVTWLGDSRRLIATPAVVTGGRVRSANLLMGTDMLSDGNKIHTNEQLWTIEGGIAMVIGFQIRDLDAIWVNDQE
ncbi:MAG: hypothetical protein LPK47_02655, partial [Bacteroidota bacterium]|nr:hypothetical protein [Bacteroidota bacterium]